MGDPCKILILSLIIISYHQSEPFAVTDSCDSRFRGNVSREALTAHSPYGHLEADFRQLIPPADKCLSGTIDTNLV